MELTLPPSRSRLLIVDDEPANAQALYQVLCGEHHISVARNAAKAFELCVALQPDVALLDVEMPGVSGFDLCKQLKAEPATRDIAVIFVTGRMGPTDEAYGFEIGAVDFIGKPINPTVVRARVRTHLTLKHQSDQLRRMVYIDGLTGVFNRRYFDMRLQQEWIRSERGQSSLAVLLADLDHFKAFNDRHGHLAGDDCLRQAAQAMAAALVRPEDILARYGGEEFGCVLPDTNGAGAAAVGRRLEQALRALGLRHGSLPEQPIVTVSIGCAAIVADVGSKPQAVLVAADQALYRAKADGRGRVAI